MSLPAAAAGAPDGARDTATVERSQRINGLYGELRRAGAEPVLPGGSGAQTYLLVGRCRGSDVFWRRLWELRTVRDAHTAFADLVMPQTPLLSAERARAVVSRAGLQVPAGSAWVIMRIDLARFVNRNAVLDDDALRRALETCVDIGDELLDLTYWPRRELRRDAWLNRRLAILIDGFGDLLRLKRLDPCAHDSLRYLSQQLLWARAVLHERSRAIAERVQQLPAITLSDPSHALPRGGVRDDWRRRWCAAVRANRLRHRNLLALSPWSLFPSDGAADFRYAELLPLLRQADSCAFHKTVSIAHWNCSEFKCFHQRAIAALQQRGQTCLVAAPV